MKRAEAESIIKDLRRQKAELESQLIYQYHFASKDIDKMSDSHCMGSAVLITLTTLGGRRTIGPVAIRDGLSAETIEAIRNDFKRSYQQAIELKPN